MCVCVWENIWPTSAVIYIFDATAVVFFVVAVSVVVIVVLFSHFDILNYNITNTHIHILHNWPISFECKLIYKNIEIVWNNLHRIYIVCVVFK